MGAKNREEALLQLEQVKKCLDKSELKFVQCWHQASQDQTKITQSWNQARSKINQLKTRIENVPFDIEITEQVLTITAVMEEYSEAVPSALKKTAEVIEEIIGKQSCHEEGKTWSKQATATLRALYNQEVEKIGGVDTNA